MAYFANGSEGWAFEQAFCDRCVHQKDGDHCRVKWLHEQWNYNQCGRDAVSQTKRFALDMLIERDDPTDAPNCRMFHARPDATEG